MAENVGIEVRNANNESSGDNGAAATTTVQVANKDETGVSKVTKYLLLGINVATLVFGLVLLIMGSFVNAQHASQHETWHVSYGILNISVMCIVLSFIIILISLLGLIGSVRENYCCLLAYCILLGIVVLVELCLAVALFARAKQNNLEPLLLKTMLDSTKHFDKEGYGGITKAWNLLQTDLRCCGVKEATEWQLNGGRFSSPNLPESCCATVPLDGGKCTTNNPNHPYHSQGCLIAIEETIEKYDVTIGIVVAVVALAQIGLIVLAAKLMKRIKKTDSCPPFY